MSAHILSLAGAITAIVAALAAMGWLLRIVLRMARRVGDIHSDWAGEVAREGVPGRKGVMARLSAIEGELTFNGGRSTKDMIRALSQQWEVTTRQLEEVARLQAVYHPPVSPVQINMHPGVPATVEGGAGDGR